MEETDFNYQKVGELFVMQYYTLMHKDSSQMYKFYQDSSCFVHGGSEMGCGEIVTGRKAINDKILSLNLHQVHTKIRQVDSHASIPNEVGPSIVVQVTGELSVAGEAMRPFVQTFILAQESQRKFFIYNDIFRYQCYDEDLDSESDKQQQVQPQELGLIIERPLSKEATSPSIPDETQYHSSDQNLPGTDLLDQRSPIPTIGGQSDALHETITGSGWTDETCTYGEPQSNGLPEEAHMTLGEEPTYPLETDEDENTTPNETNIDEIKEESPTSNEKPSHPPPGTWASRISQNISKSQSQSQYFNQSSAVKSTQSPRSTSQPLPPREQKPIKKVDRPLPEKKPFVSTNVMTSRSAPDSHQVFVGGLPPNTTEPELKDVFTRFGNILEVRVNPKNFGFVVFDNEQSVRDVMASKDESPLAIRDKRLNIEEKRQSAPKSGFGMGPSASVGRKVPLRPSNRSQKRS